MSITDTATRSFKVGDEVVADPNAGWQAGVLGRVYVISKVPTGRNGVNYIATANDGGKGLRARGSMLLPAPAGGASAALESAYKALTTTVEYVPLPTMGTVVTVSGISKIAPTALYVVLGESASRTKPNCVKLVRLGGEGGRYWPAIPAKNLTVVDAGTLVRA